MFILQTFALQTLLIVLTQKFLLVIISDLSKNRKNPYYDLLGTVFILKVVIKKV